MNRCCHGDIEGDLFQAIKCSIFSLDCISGSSHLALCVWGSGETHANYATVRSFSSKDKIYFQKDVGDQ